MFVCVCACVCVCVGVCLRVCGFVVYVCVWVGGCVHVRAGWSVRNLENTDGTIMNE